MELFLGDSPPPHRHPSSATQAQKVLADAQHLCRDPTGPVRNSYNCLSEETSLLGLRSSLLGSLGGVALTLTPGPACSEGAGQVGLSRLHSLSWSLRVCAGSRAPGDHPEPGFTHSLRALASGLKNAPCLCLSSSRWHCCRALWLGCRAGSGPKVSSPASGHIRSGVCFGRIRVEPKAQRWGVPRARPWSGSGVGVCDSPHHAWESSSLPPCCPAAVLLGGTFRAWRPESGCGRQRLEGAGGSPPLTAEG